jgi:hypothetical protein
MKNEYDANKSCFTFGTNKPKVTPTVKRSISLCGRFKAIKLISVFKLVGCSVMMLMVFNLTIELIGTMR